MKLDAAIERLHPREQFNRLTLHPERNGRTLELCAFGRRFLLSWWR